MSSTVWFYHVVLFKFRDKICIIPQKTWTELNLPRGGNVYKGYGYKGSGNGYKGSGNGYKEAVLNPLPSDRQGLMVCEKMVITLLL